MDFRNNLNLNGLGGQPQTQPQGAQVSSLNLKKGQSTTLFSLSTKKPIEKICLGLGWKTRNSVDIDLDASIMLLSEVRDAYGNPKLQVAEPHKDVIYFGQKNTGCGVVHYGDSRKGNSGGDDETIQIDLSQIPERIKEIVAIITIYESAEKSLNFALVDSAYIRVDDMTDGTPSALVTYDIRDKFQFEQSLVVAKLIKNPQGNWDFKAIGEGRNADINGVFYEFGVR